MEEVEGVRARGGVEERLELGGIEEVAQARGARGHERIYLLDKSLLRLVDWRVELC